LDIATKHSLSIVRQQGSQKCHCPHAEKHFVATGTVRDDYNSTETLKISVLTTGAAFLIGGVKGHFTGLNRLVSAGHTLLVGALAAASAFWLG
jgi:hypothetical protein